MQNKEELKDLVMEWYLRYGEREVRGDRLLELIKGTQNEA